MQIQNSIKAAVALLFTYLRSFSLFPVEYEAIEENQSKKKKGNGHIQKYTYIYILYFSKNVNHKKILSASRKQFCHKGDYQYLISDSTVRPS